MNSKNLKLLEIRISDTAGISYRTIIDLEKNYILRSGTVNGEKIDLIPTHLNELEKNRLREKLTYLKVDTLKSSQQSVSKGSDLYWQVVITGENETLQEIGVGQLPEEWGNFFRLLP